MTTAAVELEARAATDVLLATAGTYVAALVGSNIKAAGLVGAGLVELHLGAWTRLIEKTLLDSFVSGEIPRAKELRDWRLPHVDELEPIRDEAGRR